MGMIKVIPTLYKDIHFRSRLESNIAFFLDGLDIKWKYESKSFLLSSGKHYWPDFYLPKLNLWIEVKGLIENQHKKIMRDFAKEYKQDIILWSAKEQFWFSHEDSNYVCGDVENDLIYLGKCYKCNSFYFCYCTGLYSCGNCGKYDGDHMLINHWEVNKERIQFDIENINFSKIKIIKNCIKILQNIDDNPCMSLPPNGLKGDRK